MNSPRTGPGGKPGPKIEASNKDSGFQTKHWDQTPLFDREGSRASLSLEDETHVNSGVFNQMTFDASTLAVDKRTTAQKFSSPRAKSVVEPPCTSKKSQEQESSSSIEVEAPSGELPRPKSMLQHSEGIEASSCQTRKIDEGQLARDFIATKYTASSEKQRDIVVSNFKFFLCFMMVSLPKNITRFITIESISIKAIELINAIIVLMIFFTWIFVRLRKKYIRSMIASMNCQLLVAIAGLVLTIQVHHIDDPEEAEEFSRVHNSKLLMLVYNFMPIVFMDVILVCILTESNVKKILFICATIIMMQSILILEAGFEFFQTTDNIVFYISCQVGQWWFSFVFGKTVKELDEEKFRFMLQQSLENEMFKRVINAVEDAMIIVEHPSNIAFKNQSATDLFFSQDSLSEEEALKKACLFPYNRKQESAEEVSLSDILNGALYKHQVFTRHREIGLCSTMAQTQMITQLKEKKARLNDTLGFDFFLVKLIRLEQSSAAGTPSAVVIQLVDISEKIYNDGLASEQRYLTFITATVSHEMRNPLNSLLAQLANQRSLARQLAKSENTKALAELTQSLEISEAAAKLLDFNVENIVSLPKLKNKKYQKSYTAEQLDTVVGEVQQITSWTVEQRGIEVSVAYLGFDDLRLSLDKKAFQQVLLNYLSNAIKFTDKEHGKIRILIQLVGSKMEEQRAARDFDREVAEFYGGVSIVPKENADRIGFRRKSHSPLASDEDSIFTFKTRPMLILSVIDNGVGIKEEDQQRLFKLFSGLQQGGPVQAKGIGLGVVVSSMLSAELGGTSQLFSKLGHGSIFLSSFEAAMPGGLPQRRVSTRYEDCFLNGFPITAQINALPQEETADFLQYYFEKANARVYSHNCEDDGLKRILIVDDEPYNCLALLTLLKSLGLKNVAQRVDLCMSGKEAIKSVIQSIRPRGQRYDRSSQPSPSLFLSRPEFSHQGASSPQNFDRLTEEVLSSVREERDLDISLLKTVIDLGGERDCEYGLILTDCSMPFVDGYEFTECARRLFQACGMRCLEEQPRIVAVTGHFEPEFQMKAILSGMEKVLPKPMTQDVLQRVLDENRFEYDNRNKQNQ